jgi:ribonuclease Z
VLGLPGLLLTLAFSDKEKDAPPTVYGPPPLESVLRGLLVVAPCLPYPLRFAALSGGESFPSEGLGGLEASCVSVEHDVACLACSPSVRRAPASTPSGRALCACRSTCGADCRAARASLSAAAS